MATRINYGGFDGVIRQKLRHLKKPGVYTVRPSYKFAGGWVTDKPAIVATVDKKLDRLPASQKLPTDLDDIPVDVREATVTAIASPESAGPCAHASSAARRTRINKKL